MASRYHKVRVRFPSGKTFERECFRYHPGEAARIATVSCYTDHKMYVPGSGHPNVDALPEGWGTMSDGEQFAIATQAGYQTVAVAWYEHEKLVWHTQWTEER